ncbi:MAG: dicarboxylate/amino acid:cation symporter [Planctomycetota bacterium]
MKKIKLFEIILIAFILGAIFGAIVGEPARALKPLGDIFIKLLSMLVVPLIFASLSTGVAGFDIKSLGRIGGKALVVYYVTAIIAICIGLGLANISGVGTGIELGDLTKIEPLEAPALITVLTNIVPDNPVKSLAEGNMLQIVFFAILLGVAMGVTGRASDSFRRGLESLANVMYTMVRFVMYCAPVGVFALISWTVGTHGIKSLSPIFYLILLTYTGCAIHVFVVYNVILRFGAGVKPFEFLKRIKEAPLFGFSTCSSTATLPITMRLCEEKAGISKKLCRFVLPLGSTVNMDGTALYQAMVTVFIANAFNMDLTISQQAIILVTAMLASIGAAGVPGTGLITLMMVLNSAGVPLEGIGIVLGVDRIIDMARTATNVLDDAVALAYVAGTEGEEFAEGVRIQKVKTN